MVTEKRRILGFLALSALLLFVMITVPKTIGLSRAGFDNKETLSQFFFYAVTGIGSLIGIIVLFLFESRNTYRDSDYGSGLAFSSPGEKPSTSWFKRLSQFQIFLASMILFLTIGLFTYISKQSTFTGIATLAQQFTEIDSLLFSSFLIPVAENLDLMFLIALGIFILRYYARKYDWQPANFMGACYGLILIGGIFGVANHLLRYGGSDVQIATVFVFWSVGAAITIITGSFLPFLCMHFANNFFFDLGRFVSNDILTLYTGIGIFVLCIIYFLLYHNKLFGTNGGE